MKAITKQQYIHIKNYLMKGTRAGAARHLHVSLRTVGRIDRSSSWNHYKQILRIDHHVPVKIDEGFWKEDISPTRWHRFLARLGR